jgi:hypothetical protein
MRASNWRKVFTILKVKRFNTEPSKLQIISISNAKEFLRKYECLMSVDFRIITTINPLQPR